MAVASREGGRRQEKCAGTVNKLSGGVVTEFTRVTWQAPLGLNGQAHPARTWAVYGTEEGRVRVCGVARSAVAFCGCRWLAAPPRLAGSLQRGAHKGDERGDDVSTAELVAPRERNVGDLGAVGLEELMCPARALEG